MNENLLTSGKRSFSARAVLVGERIDLKALGSSQRWGSGPLVVDVRGGGLGVLFRYGVVVLFDVAPLEEDEFLRQLQPRVQSPNSERESEEIRVRIEPEAREVIEGDAVLLKDLSGERLQLVADVLSKSVVIARYEQLVTQTFDRIEPIAASLTRGQWGGPAIDELLRRLGESLLMEQQMVGRALINDTPDLLWDHPDLERLYIRLRDEFEILERFTALNRKLELISRTVQTVLDLVQNRRALRVEWYIVLLIVLEIGLTLYQMFGGG